MTTINLTPKQAAKQYGCRMMGAALGYLGATFGAAMVLDEGDPVTVITILVALVPAAFVLLMLRAVWRYMKEMDEVARYDHTQAMLIALFVVLSVGGGWGLVELFNEELPRLPIFWVFPGFFFIYGLVACFVFGRRA
jgi:cytochrome c-type biogenesis protein CcmH/NrfF